MNKHTKLIPHDVGKLILICYIAYVATYFGRTNYSSSIVAITSHLNCDNSEAGLVNSYFFAIYGIGQIVNGLLADRVNNKWMITFSLSASAVINLIMPFLPSIAAMKYIWMLNGVVQSVMWTNLVGIVADMVPIDMIPRSMTVLITSSALGTLMAYGFSSFFLKVSTWKMLFYAASAVLMLTAIIWFITVQHLDKHRVWIETTDTEPAPQASLSSNMKQLRYIFVGGGLILAILLSLLNGAHREGIISWLPSFAKDNYHISESFSVLIAIFIPIVNIFGSTLTRFLSKKLGKYGNSLTTATALYLASLILMVILRLTAWSGLFGACLLFSALSLLMTAINAAVVGTIPVEMASYGCSASLTGFLNFGYCVGSTLSTYGLGYISDHFGWDSVLDSLWIAAIVALLIGIAGSYFWSRFLRRIALARTQNA